MPEHQDNAEERTHRRLSYRLVKSAWHGFLRGGRLSWKIGHGVFKFLVLPILALVSCVDFWLEWKGLPDDLHQRVLADINTNDNDLQCSLIQLGLVRGVVVHDVCVRVPTKLGLAEFRADKVSLRADRWELLCGQVLPRKVSLDNGSLRLLAANGADSLSVSEVFLDGALEENNRVVFNGKGESAGLDIEVHAIFGDGRRGIMGFLSAPHGDAPEVDEALQSMVARFNEHWKKLLPRGNESRMRVEITGAFDAPETWHFAGYVNVSDAYLSKMSALQCACEFSGTAQRLVLSNIHLMLLGHTDNVTARNVVLYPLEKAVEVSDVDGVVTSQAMSDLLEVLMEDTSAVSRYQEIVWGIPWNSIRFHGSVEHGPLHLDGLKASLQLSLPETNCQNIVLCGGKVNLKIADGVVVMDDSTLTVDSDEAASFAGRWDVRRNTLTASARGAFDLRRLLKGNDKLSEMFSLSGAPCSFSCELELPELDIVQARGKGMVHQSGLRLLGGECSEAILPFSVSDGVATIEKGYATRRSNGMPLVEFSARASLKDLASTGKLTCVIPSFILSGGGQGSETGALAIHGTASWNSTLNTFAMELEGNSYVETFYHEFFKRFGNDVTGMLTHIDCREGHPLRFALAIPEFPLHHLEQLQVQGSMAFEDVAFHGLEMKSASCKRFTANDTSCDFMEIHGRTAAGDECQFNLHVNYAPLELTFSNCKLWGDPRVVGAFFVDKTVEDVYQSVFKDIRWSAASRPTLEMPRLVFYNEETWRVNSDGIYLNAKDMTYRHLKVDEANIIVMLDLPSAVVVEPVTVMKNEQWVSGKVEVDLVGVKQCRFQVFRTQMGVDVLDVLGGLWPEVTQTLQGVEISKDCQMDFLGSMFLTGEPRLRLDGCLAAQRLSYNGISVQDADMQWSFDSGDFHWNLTNGKVLGGSISTSGEYNFRHYRGRTLLAASDLAFEEIQRYLGHGEHETIYPGRMTGEINLSFLKNWAGHKIHLDGAGHIHLDDADLWRMPVLSGLEKILKSATGGWLSAGVGRISEADMDVQFNGQRIVASRIQTNGTIIALNGNGSYVWTDDERPGTLHFTVNGTPVKNVKMLSLLLSPVSYLFQAELTGTVDNTRWKMKSLLDLLF